MPETRELEFPPPVSVTEEDFETETAYFRVHTTISHPSDASLDDQMNIIEASGTLEFWEHPEEDVYSEKDGDAV